MEYELMRVREFLAANWSMFESFCESNGDNAEEIDKTLEDNQ
ncbi:hypothetical protein HWB57_gp125 [Erwinia phage vB_EamM-Bue1]|uniref:Uncharacterized protein n=1 Tax=Erwinia phage vB_EamM-Bue1 TaxID=2099338 RepID=A0A2P1JUD4_9CAUD|nr:hypothetical protein HWB57_gp125 [Erwinia phage vB_EamM-Bue1]AVO22962.1 hypothetical protein [Erwinia phage vB_EamM-Bue1]